MTVAFMCVALLCVPPPLEAPGCPRTYLQYIEYSAGYLSLNLSQDGLCSDDVDRWARLLGASEAQQQFMRIMHEQFVEEYNRYCDRHIPDFLAHSAQADEIRLAEGTRSPALADALRSLRRHADRLRTQLLSIEEAYIESLGPILTDEQSLGLDVLRSEAIRRQYRIRVHPIRWSGIELRPLWMQVETHALSPEDLRSIETILEEYEAILTPLVRRQAEAQWAISGQVLRLLAEMDAGVLTPSEFQVRYRRVHARFADALKRTARLNESTLRRMVDSVDEKHGAALLSIAKRAAFPELYPDDAALHHFFAAIDADESVDDETRAAAAALRDTYNTLYEAVSRDLEAICVEWGDKMALGEQGYLNQDLPEALEPLMRRRHEMSVLWMGKLNDALGTQ